MNTESKYNGRSDKERKEAIAYLQVLVGDVEDIGGLYMKQEELGRGAAKAIKDIASIESIDTSTEEGAQTADEIIDDIRKVLEEVLRKIRS